MNAADEDFFTEQVCRTGISFLLFQSIAVVKGEISHKMNGPAQGSVKSQVSNCIIPSHCFSKGVHPCK